MALKPEIKDLIIFFTLALTNINFNIWSIVIPYYYSHAKYFNPSVTMKTVFNAILFCYVGFNVSTFLFPTLLFFLGLKGTLLFGAFVSGLNNMAIYTFSSALWICVCTATMGFCYKHCTTVIILYFTEKYPVSASKLYSIATSGFIITGFFWANLITFYINPDNEGMTATSFFNGYEETYFPIEISSRLRGILNIQAVFTLSVVLLASLFFNDPDKYKNNLDALIRWFRGENIELTRSIQLISEQLSESAVKLYTPKIESIDNIRATSLMESHLIDSVALSEERSSEHRSDASDTSKEKPNSVRSQVVAAFKTSKFWLLFYTAIFRVSLPSYYIDNSKIIGYKLVKNDQLITQVYSAAAFLAMTSSALAGNIVERYGLLNCYLGSLGANLILEFITFTIIQRYPYLFLLTLAFSRTVANFTIQLSNITLFNCYQTDVALQLAKVYELHSFLANAVMIIINQLLYVDGVFTYVFLVYFMLDGTALAVTFYMLRPQLY